nr:hypothetical protein HCOI_01585200 [Haemonchus contortus]
MDLLCTHSGNRSSSRESVRHRYVKAISIFESLIMKIPGQDVESLIGYDSTFNQSDAFYKVLTVCIYEKYDLAKLSPRFARPDFLFRCVCNYDRCNSHNTFQGYLYGVRQDNQ